MKLIFRRIFKRILWHDFPINIFCSQGLAKKTLLFDFPVFKKSFLWILAVGVDFFDFSLEEINFRDFPVNEVLFGGFLLNENIFWDFQ